VVSCPPTVAPRHCIGVIISCSPFPVSRFSVLQRPAYRAGRVGERRPDLTEHGGQPAELGIGRPDLGRGLAAFGLVDAVVGIEHHRLPGDPS
jgi:hypothetical protein